MPAVSEVLFAILPAVSEVLFAYPLRLFAWDELSIKEDVKVVICAKADDVDKIAIKNRKKAIDKQGHLFSTCSD